MSAPLPVGSECDLPSRQIGRFTVLGLVGRGELGEVYAAYDPELDRRVALKVLVHADDRSGLARLRREAMAMARLSHPNVARVFDVGSIDSRLFIAMEFIRGQTLRAWLAEQPRTWRDVREVFLAAGHGLAAAHREGIIHRDFKPDNVLIDEEGRARVVDFGLAIPTDESVRTADQAERTATPEPDLVIGGTPAYMAPEQHIGCPPDARADQYSFCVALFEALYGRRPFVGRTWQTLSPQVLRGSLETLAGARRVPPHLRRVVLRGLSSLPGRRYPDMDVLLAELAHEPRPSRAPRHLLLGAVTLGLTAASVAYSMPEARPTPGAVAPSEPPSPMPSPALDRQDLQIDALLGQMRLARMLRRSDRPGEALDLLRAVTDAAEQSLGPTHPLSVDARDERDELANELADQSKLR
jgi:serine/threonine protein kinase